VDASAGLVHCHAKGVIHRDIATRNFLVDSFQRVTIADFGLSLRTDSHDKTVSRESVAEPIPIKWAAPETLMHAHYSLKTDVHSFGIFLWEMVARCEPYPGLNMSQAGLAVCDPNNPLRPRIPGYSPPQLAMVMEAAWQYDPVDRPSMGVINKQLFAFLMSLKNTNAETFWMSMTPGTDDRAPSQAYHANTDTRHIYGNFYQERRTLPAKSFIGARSTVVLSPFDTTKGTFCDECNSNVAAYKCAACDQFLCKDCKVSIHKSGSRARHTVRPIVHS